MVRQENGAKRVDGIINPSDPSWWSAAEKARSESRGCHVAMKVLIYNSVAGRLLEKGRSRHELFVPLFYDQKNRALATWKCVYWWGVLWPIPLLSLSVYLKSKSSTFLFASACLRYAGVLDKSQLPGSSLSMTPH